MAKLEKCLVSHDLYTTLGPHCAGAQFRDANGRRVSVILRTEDASRDIEIEIRPYHTEEEIENARKILRDVGELS